MSTEASPLSIVTPPVRLAFPALFEPKPVAKGNPTLKYQAVLLIPPSVDLKPFYECVKAAMLEEWGKVEKLPARNNPIKSCEEKELDGYEPGWHFINVKSNYAPTVVDQRRQDILDPERIFAGCWVRCALNAFAWKHDQGGKGVSFGLNAVQLVREDTRLDGRKSATDLFDEVEVEEAPEHDERNMDEAPKGKAGAAAGKPGAAKGKPKVEDADDLFG